MITPARWMTALVFIVSSALPVNPAHAQQTPRNLLGARYTEGDIKQALVSQANWTPFPRTPGEWPTQVPAALLDKLVKAGEAATETKWEPISATVSLDYVRTGDRTRHSRISFAKRNALFALIVAESIEGKGRFMEPILNGVWSICEESFWGVPAHIGKTGLPDVTDPVVELFGAETASLMALTDYFVGPKLDQVNKLFRKRIYLETNRRLFVPMLTKGDTYGWMSKTNPVNNWNPWINSNWITSTLFLEPDPARRAQMIHGAMLGLDRYLNSLGDAGGCDEGPGYWGAAGASTFDCLDLLSRATGGKVDIFAEPLVRNMGAYIYKAHIGGPWFINFADAAPQAIPDGHMVYRFGQAIRDPQMMQFGLWVIQTYGEEPVVSDHQKPRKLFDVLNYAKLPREKSTYQPLRDNWISDVQVMTARSDNGLFVGTHGGHNAESHNHNDVGDFVIYADGQPFIVDVGSGTYTSRTFSSHRYDLWFTASTHHNLPTINGKPQSAGREFAAKNVACELKPERASLAMDLAAAYPAEVGVTRWQRVVALDRAKNCVDVTDDYALKAPATSLTQSFMTVATPKLGEPGKISFVGERAVTVTLSYDAGAWTASVEEPPQTGPDYGSIPHKWDDRKVKRVLLTAKSPAQSGKLVWHFTKA